MRQADLRLRRRAVASQHGSQLESSGQDAPDDDTYGKIRSIAIQQRAVSAVPPRPCPGERDFQTNSQVARPDREVTAGEGPMEDNAKKQNAGVLFFRKDRRGLAGGPQRGVVFFIWGGGGSGGGVLFSPSHQTRPGP